MPGICWIAVVAGIMAQPTLHQTGEQVDLRVEPFDEPAQGRDPLLVRCGHRDVVQQQVALHTEQVGHRHPDPALGQTAVFVAEIGDVHGFSGPAQLTCWAGLTPSHHESDTTVHRGRITKQGSRLVRWAAIESVKMLPKTSHIGAIRDKVAHRRGNRNIGAVAAARKQLELVFYGLRDHHVRALHRSPRAA